MTKGRRVFTELDNAKRFVKEVIAANGQAKIEVHAYVCGGVYRDKYHVNYVCDLNKLRAI